MVGKWYGQSEGGKVVTVEKATDGRNNHLDQQQISTQVVVGEEARS